MVGIYTRQSVEKKDSISIESQIDFCKKEFSELENFKVYTDKGFSGKDTNRPAFENMMDDIKTGSISKVVVYKLDRISRSTLDFANIIEEFKKFNVEFISSTEKFDTSTPMGNAMLSIIMVFAQLERETIQKRIKDNYYARGKRGFYMGGRCPYGFEKDKTIVDGKKTSMLIPNNDQIPPLIKMYQLYADTDMSLGKVSDYLNENDIPAAQGGKWDSCKISRILRNPTYVKADADIYLYYKNKGCIISNDISDFIGTNGCFLYGKRKSNERKYTKVENHVLSLSLHKGVIDSTTWLLCQYKLDNNKQIKNSGKGKHTWLSGIAKCGYCGYAVSVIKAGHGNQRYFNCRGKTNLKICDGHQKPIIVKKVESDVKDVLFSQVEKLKGVELKQLDNESAINNNLKIQIINIDTKIGNLIQQLSEAKDVTMKYINSEIAKLDSEKSRLTEEMNKNTYKNTKQMSIEDLFEKVDKWDNLKITEKRDICSYFINKVLIVDDGIKIDWKEPFPLK